MTDSLMSVYTIKLLEVSLNDNHLPVQLTSLSECVMLSFERGQKSEVWPLGQELTKKFVFNIKSQLNRNCRWLEIKGNCKRMKRDHQLCQRINFVTMLSYFDLCRQPFELFVVKIVEMFD